jgi:predicted DNA-binding transcriptional regulator AlpA
MMTMVCEPRTVYRPEDLMAMFQLSRRQLMDRVRKRAFPPPLLGGRKAPRWTQKQIDAFLAGKEGR